MTATVTLTRRRQTPFCATVTGERFEHFVRITVHDHGPGIAAENHESVFEAFVQGFKFGHERLPCNRVGPLDLVLQLQNAVQKRFSRRWAARHINVYRYDAITSAHHRVRVMVVPSAVGT